MAYLALALRLILAGVCLAALIGKLRGSAAWREFRSTLRDVGVPGRNERAVAVAIVGAEAVVAALAPWPHTGVAGALLATTLFAVLTIGVAHAVRRGSVALCRCFGVRGTRLSTVHVARNAVLVAAAVTAAATTAAADSAPRRPAGVALAVAAATFGCAVIIFWEDLAELLTAHPRRTTRVKGQP